MNPEQQQEGLLVTGVGEDGVLDFGACYSGNGTCQMLTLRNITPEVLLWVLYVLWVLNVFGNYKSSLQFPLNGLS